MTKYRSLFDRLDDPKPDIPPPPNVTLRGYQADAVDAVFREWREGSASTLVVLPTGTGKSVVFSEVMRRAMEASR